MTVSIKKKITMKEIVGGRPTPPAADKTGDEAVNWVGRIIGVASGLKTGESQYGPYVALMGNFAATRLDDKGEIAVNDKGERLFDVRAGQAFLPDVACNLVSPLLDNAPKGTAVQFGFDIGVERDDTAATGYVYVCRSLVEPAENDPLTLLMAKHMPTPKLEAPKDGKK